MILSSGSIPARRESPHAHPAKHLRFLALALLCVCCFAQTVSADDWSTDSFSGHHRAYISGTPTALTDYQVKYVLYNVTGTDTAENIYLPGIAQPDYNDVRFASSDGTALDYWMETPTGTDHAIFWVKIPSIPEGPENTVAIDIYYGNSTIESGANGDATFPLFDNFDGSSLNTTRWTSVITAYAGVSNSILTLPAYTEFNPIPLSIVMHRCGFTVTYKVHIK